MIKESITVQDVCDLMNEFLRLDPEATKELVQTKVPCNDTIADHPSIQVSASEKGYEVGIVGILNGLFGTGTNSMGAICYLIDDDGKIEGFQKVFRPHHKKTLK